MCDLLLQCSNYTLQVFVQSRGVTIFITHLRDKPRITFEKAGIVQLLGKDAFFENVSQAIQRIEIVEREVVTNE